MVEMVHLIPYALSTPCLKNNNKIECVCGARARRLERTSQPRAPAPLTKAGLAFQSAGGAYAGDHAGDVLSILPLERRRLDALQAHGLLDTLDKRMQRVFLAAATAAVAGLFDRGRHCEVGGVVGGEPTEGGGCPWPAGTKRALHAECIDVPFAQHEHGCDCDAKATPGPALPRAQPPQLWRERHHVVVQG
eukprot:scaffold53331_cov68-Phaeocystis_antarctica.AAC.10